LAAGDNVLVQKAWAKLTLVEAKKEIYFKKFWSASPDAMILMLNDIEGKPGDEIIYPLLMALTGAGISGDSTLEGNEEALTYYSDTIVVDQQRHAVRIDGLVTEKRTGLRIRTDARTLLKRWLAEKIDNDMFVALGASCTEIKYGGDATSTSDLDSADKAALADIDYIKAAAMTNSPKIPSLKIGGRNTYVLILHPHVVYDLRQDSTWQQLMREAATRGNQNPIFEGSLAMHNNIIIHEHEQIPIATTWGSGGTTTGAINLFLGASAGAIAFGKRPFWREKSFDYDNETGFAVGAMYGVNKSVFNSLDYGTVAYKTYRTALSI
jgi:N4-gp56 family major capsid protein